MVDGGHGWLGPGRHGVEGLQYLAKSVAGACESEPLAGV